MDQVCRDDPCGRTANDHLLTSQPSCYPILRGGIDVRPYRSPLGNWCIPREAIAKPLERYQSPKLLVVKSTDHLQAALDTRGHVTLQTLYLLHLRAEGNIRAPLAVSCLEDRSPLPQRGCPAWGAENVLDDLYFFLALLNSRLLSDYIYVLHTAYKWVQPQIEQNVLARLPVPIVQTGERQKIIDLSKLLVQACSAEGAVVEWKRPIRGLYEEQELAIRTLYASALPELFTATEIHCPD